MAPNQLLIFIKLLLLFNLIESNPYKLNVPKVLLPFHSSKIVSFTLEAKSDVSPDTEDLCFVWSSSRPDVISIQPVYDNNTQNFNGYQCSNRAIVSAISKHPQRMTSIIFAKEIKTDKLIRCDVIVDKIESIRIKHTTTHLYLEDSPESFTAEALDSEQNTFTSIDGLPFEWKVIDDSTNDDSRNVLRTSKFIESEYEVSESIRNLESIGLNGHKILIEGLKTGTANVQAKLIDPFYKDTLKTPPVRLLVVANILIEPSYPVYLLVGTTIKYNVFLIKQSSIDKISLPSQQYFFETRSADTAFFDTRTGNILHANTLGQTEVVLIDRNMNEEFFREQKIVLPPPSAKVYVVQLESLTFSIKNWKSWVLVTGREYEIVISLYSKNRDLIHMSDELKIESELPKFSIRDKTTNGSYILAKTLEKGLSVLRGSLGSVKGEQELEILDPIVVRPEVLIFAYNPIGDVYEHLLDVTGGSGAYYYQTKNTSVSKISPTGVVQVFSNRVGSSKILVSDQRNSDINSESLVIVTEPIDLYIEPCPVETRVKSKLTLNIKMNGFDRVGLKPINDCSKLKFNVLIQDEDIFKFDVVGSPVSGACAQIILTAENVGKTNVKIVYDKLTSQELQISSFSELKSYKKSLLLTKKSSYVITMFDGPLSDLQTYSSEFTVTTPGVINIEHLGGDSIGGRYSYKISCLDKSNVETEIKFYVSNKQTHSNKCPLKFEYTLPVRCGVPKKLSVSQLFVNNDENENELYNGLKWKCPIKQSSKLVVANLKRDLNFELLVKDENDQKFDNFTSLKFEWKYDSYYLSKPTEPGFINLKGVDKNTLTRVNGDGHNIVFYQTLKPRQKQGESKVQVKFLVEDKKYIEECLSVRFVDDVRIEPEQMVLFNHPSNLQQLKLQAGSGYFHGEVDSKESNVLKITQVSDTSLQISPLINNGLCTVNVFDYCVPPESLSLDRNEFVWDPSAKSNIKVAGINSIMVNYEDDKVQEGDKLKIYVQIVDATGNLIQSKYFKLMNLEPKIYGDSNLVKLEQSENTELPNTGLYIMSGIKSGFLSIEFEAQSDNKVIKSPKKEIEVFTPIRVDPKFIELILGAEYQIQWTGGPVLASDMNIKFEIENDRDFIEINETGLVRTLELGLVRVNVKFSNTKKLYTQDVVDIKIVELKFIKLNAPLTSIKSGNTLPVYVLANNLSPFNFATSKKLKYKWSLIDDTLGVIERDNDFSLQIKTQGTGVLKISVQVENENKLFTDSIEITVFAPGIFEIFETRPENVILTTSKTSLQLKTNYDSLSHDITYELQFYTQECSNSSLLVSSSGLLHVGDVKGQECLVGLLTRINVFSKIETLFYLIKVKPIVYPMFVLKDNKVSVSYHDNLGDKFLVVNTKNSLKVNRNDLIDFVSMNRQVYGHGQGVSFMSRSEENSFVLRNLKQGLFIMEVRTSWNSNPDFYVQNIKTIGFELKEIVVGDLLCNVGSDSSGSLSVVKAASGLIGVASQPGNIFLGKNKEFVVKGVDRVKILGKNKYLTNTKHLGETESSDFSIGFTVSSQNQAPECSSDFEQVYNSNLNPFKCQLGLYNSNNQKLNYLDRILGTEVVYKNHQWVCQAKFTTNSEQILYELMEHHVDLTSSKKALLDQEPTNIKIFIDSKNSLTGLDDDLNSRKTNTLEFVPAFYVQTKLIELAVTRNSHFNLIIKSTSLVQPHLVITTNIPSLIKIRQLTTDGFSHVYDVEKIESKFDLTGYANVLQQQNGNLYVQILNTLNQQVERVPVKFSFTTSGVFEVKEDKGFCKSLKCVTQYFEFTKNPITNLLIFSLIFVVMVLIYLKLRTPQGPVKPTMAAATQGSPVSPRTADMGSFNPYRNFTPNVDGTPRVLSPSSSRVSNASFQEDQRPPEYPLFSVDSRVQNTNTPYLRRRFE